METNLVKKAQEKLSEAVNANDRLAALYHELAMESTDLNYRQAYLELESRVRRDQEELVEAMKPLLDID